MPAKYRKHGRNAGCSIAEDTTLDCSIHICAAAAQDENLWQVCPESSFSDQADNDGCLQRNLTMVAGSLQQWLSWLTMVTVVDPQAHMQFSANLSKPQRAYIHRLVEHDHKGELETCSSGIAAERSIAVYRHGCAPKQLEMAGEPHFDFQARRLYRLACVLQTCNDLSLDEMKECLATGQMAGQLASLQQQLLAWLPVLQRLMAAASTGNAADIHSIAQSFGETITHGLPDLDTGELPLQEACRQGHLDTVRALVAAGAPLEAENSKGQTPLQVARVFEHTDVEAVLIQAGAQDADEQQFPLSVAAAELG